MLLKIAAVLGISTAGVHEGEPAVRFRMGKRCDGFG